MSVPKDRDPDPHADPLVAAVLRASLDETSLDCPDAELLALYAERELRDEELAGVDCHVVGCARCQATVAAFISGAPEPSAPPAQGGAPVAPWWAGWRWMVPLATAAGVLVVAVWLGQEPADRTPDPSWLRQQARAGATPASSPGGRKAQAAKPAEAKAEEEQAARAAGVLVNGQRSGRPNAAPQMADRLAVPPAAPAAESQQAAPAQAPAAQARGDAAARMLRVAPPGSLSVLTGTVTYRENVVLPSGAVVEVRLLDVSRADAPATRLGHVEIVTGGEQVPVPFALRYDAAAIQPGRRYVVEATVAVDGRVTWRTATRHPVSVAGTAATPVTVTVVPVR